ncbi:MAG: hypothetical protein WC091_18710 [Sulfuricellaceae bacterium]
MFEIKIRRLLGQGAYAVGFVLIPGIEEDRIPPERRCQRLRHRLDKFQLFAGKRQSHLEATLFGNGGCGGSLPGVGGSRLSLPCHQSSRKL